MSRTFRLPQPPLALLRRSPNPTALAGLLRRRLSPTTVQAGFAAGFVAAALSLTGTVIYTRSIIGSEALRLTEIREHGVLTAAKDVEAAIRGANKPLAEAAVDKLLGYPAIQEVTIVTVDQAGNDATLAQASRPPRFLSAWSRWLVSDADLGDKTGIDVFGDGGKRLGELSVVADRGFLARDLDRLLGNGIAVAILAGGVTGLLAALFFDAIAAAPARRLAAAVRSVDLAAPPAEMTVAGLSALTDIADAVSALLRQSKHGHEQRSKMEHRLSLALRGTRAVIWEADLVGKTRWWSDNARSLFGYHMIEGLPPDAWEQALHPEDRDHIVALTDDVLAGMASDFSAEYRIVRRDGEILWVEARGAIERDDTGTARRFVGTMTDITDRRRALEQLTRLATTDGLTGLANSTVIGDLLERTVALSAKRSRRVAVLHITVDRCDEIVGAIGHDPFDVVLLHLSRRLVDTLPPTATLGRMGLAEFVTLIPDVATAYETARLARDILATVEEPLPIDQRQRLTVSASVGVAMSPDDGETSETLLAAAKLASQRATNEGGAQAAFSSTAMDTQMRRRLALEDALRADDAALKSFVFQPRVSTADGRMVAAEALLRARFAGETIRPSELLETMEAGGLVTAVTTAHIDAVCAQIAAWTQTAGSPPPPIAVNLSLRQAAAPDLADIIFSALDRYHLKPQHLSVEVSSSALERPRMVRETIARLRMAGVQVLLDSFGASGTPIMAIAEMPLDGIVIDRELITRLHSDPASAAAIEAVCAIGRALHLTVTAVGVERQDQLDLLRNAGVAAAQGVLFAQPVDPGAFAKTHLRRA